MFGETHDLRARVSDDTLRACIEDKYDPWTQTFDLLFRENPSMATAGDCYQPTGFALLNPVQRKFVGFDSWYGRYLNGGFDAAFFDPACSIVAAYLAIPILGWPEFEEHLKQAIEGTLAATDVQIRAAVESADVWSAGNQLAEVSGWKTSRETSTQREAMRFFESWYSTSDQQQELDRRVLASIWRWRQSLIAPLH